MTKARYKEIADKCPKCGKLDAYRIAPVLLCIYDSSEVCSCPECKHSYEDCVKDVTEHALKYGNPYSEDSR